MACSADIADTAHARVTLTSMLDVQRIGSYLRATRERKGWTLTKLAAESGLTGEFITAVEDGDPRCEVGTIAQLASTLGLELTVHTRSGQMKLLSKLRARADKHSRESILARGIYGAATADQVGDEVLYARTAHLNQQWHHAQGHTCSSGFRLASALPARVWRILTDDNPTAPELLDLCQYSMPYLFVRLVLEHPGWLADPLTHNDRGERRDIAWVVGKYGRQSAPDHRGKLINNTKRRRSYPAPPSTWTTKCDAALVALKPSVAQAVADALSRELWGRWIMQDLKLYAFAHEHRLNEAHYLVTEASTRPRGRYLGEPTFRAASSWPEAEVALLTDSAWARNVRSGLFTCLDTLAAVHGAAWAEAMYVLQRPLDILTMKAIADIFSPDSGVVSPGDAEYENALASLTGDGTTTHDAIRHAVIAAERRTRLRIVPEPNSKSV